MTTHMTTKGRKLMDEIFNMLVSRAYASSGVTDFTLEDVKFVFEYYFTAYELTFGENHPHIRLEQIERIIQAMPVIIGNCNSEQYIDAEGYTALIDKHFETQYRNCDYNVNHFFSGDIRAMRYFETLY